GYWHAKSESKHEFEVCKLVPGPGGGENNNTVNYYWAKVTNLDGYAVFVGSHQSFCLPADPLLNNRVKGNCIYFAFGGDSIFSDDFGVFNLVDQTVERFATDSNSDNTRTFWFLPMPWNIHEHKEGQERMFQQRQTGPSVCMAKSKTGYRKYNQQREGNNKVSTGQLANKFQALLIDDDGEDDEDQDDR
ncbi:unnamed protein product, partial [Linum tenue]